NCDRRLRGRCDRNHEGKQTGEQGKSFQREDLSGTCEIARCKYTENQKNRCLKMRQRSWMYHIALFSLARGTTHSLQVGGRLPGRHWPWACDQTHRRSTCRPR